MTKKVVSREIMFCPCEVLWWCSSCGVSRLNHVSPDLATHTPIERRRAVSVVLFLCVGSSEPRLSKSRDPHPSRRRAICARPRDERWARRRASSVFCVAGFHPPNAVVSCVTGPQARLCYVTGQDRTGQDRTVQRTVRCIALHYRRAAWPRRASCSRCLASRSQVSATAPRHPWGGCTSTGDGYYLVV